MNNVIKKICLVILGLLQGTLGSYLALLGWAFAFPETSPGTKDYVKDMFFVPFGYFIMFAWLRSVFGRSFFDKICVVREQVLGYNGKCILCRYTAW